jgi:glutathione S-transferase
MQSAEHLKRHPWGKVPAITLPSGFTLYESRAICKYLTKKYSFPLLPAESDLEANALVDQADSVETLYFADPAGKVVFEKFVKMKWGQPPNETVVSDALKAVESYFDVAEKLLQEREYMAGNEFTLVDIAYIPTIQRLFAVGHGDLVTGRKAVNAWWERCMNRPAIKKVVDADNAAAAAASK